MEQVVLVDEHDQETGVMEKFQAHLEGRLHRAVSVFVFNAKGELLLQQRASGKYHSANLWTNTCCTHPRPGETPHAAATRRLQEEMGIASELKEAFSFIYNAVLDNNLTEHELDHVYTGITDMRPMANTGEVAAWRYTGMVAVENEIRDHPEQFTEWFKICFRDWRQELHGQSQL